MPAVIAPTPSDAPVGQQKKGSGDQNAAIPFARAAKWHIEQGVTNSGITINTATPGTFNYTLPSYGYLSAVVLTLTAVGGTGTAAVYFEDAPWSIISSIGLFDVNGVPIWGPFGGYSAFLASKYGGYRLFGPDGSSTLYGGATTGTLAGLALGNGPVFSKGTSGNFQAVLPIFLEFGRDGLGCLPNLDASARYNLQVVLANATASSTTGPVYTTAPTGYPTLTMQVEVVCRSQPPAADLYGNQNSITPPAVGTVQYWSQQTFSNLAGAQTIQLSRVGNLIRNQLLVFRDPGSTPTRAIAETTDMPATTIEYDWDVGVRFVSNITTQRLITYQISGMDVPVGVLWYPNTSDPDKLAVSEFGDEWMATVGATKLTLRFTPQATVNLTVLTNDLVPASGQVYAAPALSGGY